MDRQQPKKNKTKRAAKKAAVLGTRKKNLTPMVIVLAVVALLVGAAVWMTSDTDRTAQADPVAGSTSTARKASAVSLPVSLFADGKARHFEHVDGDFTIRYFVIKSSDGVIRAAYDACDVCWPAGKGYYQDGDHMVCRNCGRRFASILVNEVQGGCNPAPLNRYVENGKVVIQIEDILAGKPYFNFKGKASS
jgi:uncharacterized membrane protein